MPNPGETQNPPTPNPSEILNRVVMMLHDGVVVDGRLYIVRGRFNKVIRLWLPENIFSVTLAKGCLSVEVGGRIEGSEIKILSVSYSAGQG